MRKFFNRLTHAGPGTANRGVDRSSSSGYDAKQEKVALSADKSDGAQQQQGGGERVRALTARFENLAAGNDVQSRTVHSLSRSVPPPNDAGSSEGPSEPAHNKSGDNVRIQNSRRQRSPLFDFNKALPQITATEGGGGEENDNRHASAAPAISSVSKTELARRSSAARSSQPSKSSRPEGSSSQLGLETDGLSPNGAASGPPPVGPENGDERSSGRSEADRKISGAPKAVAFAPSPKKPNRLAQTNLNTDPLPEKAMDEISNHLATAPSSTSSVNFAKPTLASVARARTGSAKVAPPPESAAPLSAYPAGLTVSPTSRAGHTKQNTDSTASSTARTRAGAAPMLRRNSSSGGRRYNDSSQSYDRPRAPPQANTVNISTTNPQLGGAIHLPNSIPFVSHPSFGGLLRSASPQSFAGTVSSSGAGGVAPDFLGGSRRSSWQGRYHSGGSVNAMTAASSLRSIGAPSWSEMTQDDLVNNLGARERTRQEVLWELVASEERYLQELEKTKALYIDALLHPHTVSTPSSPHTAHSAALASLEGRTKRAMSPRVSASGQHAMDLISADDGKAKTTLPIASRFMTESSENGPRGASAKNGKRNGIAGSRRESHQDLGGAKGGQASFYEEAKDPGSLKRWSQRNSKRHESTPTFASSQMGYNLSEDHGLAIKLPASLRSALEAVDKGILEGHALLSEALRLRYEEQWPLVRSLADVFARFSYIFVHYHEYVLNLERALDCLEEAALMERAMRGKRLRKDRLSTSIALGRTVASLDAAATEQGECGLAIFLSLPFQRLLKYPLLFQNLLFHTDASTFEFENTVKMVVDVERLVRSIEDEKVNKEERDKTIDAFARIEGVNDRSLLRPKADRFLIEEIPMYEENPRRAVSESDDPSSSAGASSNGEVVANTAMSTPLAVGSGNLRASIRNKRSYRRLSDLLSVSSAATGAGAASRLTKAPNMGSKRDVWIVRFSDVELRCQRVGVTALPLISSTALSSGNVSSENDGASNGMTKTASSDAVETEEEQRMRDEFKRTRESKERMRALRNTTLRSKTRNLYKFISVAKWKVSRDRRQMVEDLDLSDGLATALEEDEEEEEEEAVSEDGDGERDEDSVSSQETDGGMLDPEHYIRQSKLSFSYGAHDQVEPRLRSTAGGLTSNGRPTSSRSLQSSAMLKRHSMGSSGVGGGGSSGRSSTNAMSSNSLANHGMPLSRAVIVASRSRQDKFGSRLRQEEAHQRRGSLPNAASVPCSEGGRGSSMAVDTSDEAEGPKLTLEGDEGTSAEKLETETQQLPTQPSFFGDNVFDSNMHLVGALVETGIAR